MRIVVAFFVLAFISCSTPEKKPIVLEEVSLGVAEVSDYPKMLSEWGLFKEPLRELIPANHRMFSYEINSPLFSDYAHKARFIKLPEAQNITYHETEVLDFPKETVLIKNFYYTNLDQSTDRRIMETRLLVKEDQGWEAIVYQWNEDQTDAERMLLGEQIPIRWKNEEGIVKKINYGIPSQPQCKSCHDLNGNMTPIGPSVRQLNRGEQLANWINKGWLESTPDSSLPKLADYSNKKEALDLRARAWLEVNCAHCHRREGPAKNSGLYLLASQSDPYRLGVNKPPIAAGKGSGGLKYNIVPGNPDQSILVHRITSLEPGEMMPELGRSQTHEEGVQLVREWIESMD